MTKLKEGDVDVDERGPDCQPWQTAATTKSPKTNTHPRKLILFPNVTPTTAITNNIQWPQQEHQQRRTCYNSCFKTNLRIKKTETRSMPGSHSSGNILQTDVKFYAGRSRLLGLQQTQEEQRIWLGVAASRATDAEEESKKI